MAKILARLELHADKKLKERLERKKYWRIQKRKDKKRKKKTQRRENELQDFKDLLSAARRWEEARFLREYIQEVEKNTDYKGKLMDRIKWANEKTDWYDPLIEKKDKLLKSIDRATLKLTDNH